MSSVVISGIHDTFEDHFRSAVVSKKHGALAIASAYVTRDGALALMNLFKKSRGEKRIVIGLSGWVSHPQAIRLLVDAGWNVRLATHGKYIFHPKMMVAGSAFTSAGAIKTPSVAYLGSANFTGNGLRKNLEVGLTTEDTSIVKQSANAFSTLWALSDKATQSAISTYEDKFTEIMQRRTLEDLSNIDDVSTTGGDQDTVSSGGASGKKRKKSRTFTPKNPALSSERAKTIWVGLESHTGNDGQYQVEFPKAVGERLANLTGTKRTAQKDLAFICQDDTTRNLAFGWYGANNMWRLNVGLEVPRAAWAKRSHKGVLVIRVTQMGRLKLSIERESEAAEVIAKSKALGTWGSTATRSYGWF